MNNFPNCGILTLFQNSDDVNSIKKLDFFRCHSRMDRSVASATDYFIDIFIRDHCRMNYSPVADGTGLPNFLSDKAELKSNNKA